MENQQNIKNASSPLLLKFGARTNPLGVRSALNAVAYRMKYSGTPFPLVDA